MWKWCVLIAALIKLSVSHNLRYWILRFYSPHHCNLASQRSAAVGGVRNGISRNHLQTAHPIAWQWAKRCRTWIDTSRPSKRFWGCFLHGVRTSSQASSWQINTKNWTHIFACPFHLSWLWFTMRIARSRQQKKHFVATFKTTTCQPPQSVP